MTNKYLAKLHGLESGTGADIFKTRDPQEPSKPSKPGFEGFEDDLGWRISKNSSDRRTAEPCANSTAENQERGTLTNPQNLQNLRSPSAPGDGTRVTIVQLPAVGLRYRRTFAHLQLRPPDYVPEDRWRMAITDGRTFLREWGSQAQALNWSARDLFGLVPVPPHAKPNFNRLSRYDQLGLCWTLEGRAKVVALTGKAAVIRTSTGARLTYHRHGRPALGPVGDSLEDFAP